jgi:hypothetical protein
MNRENFDSLKAILTGLGFGIDPNLLHLLEGAVALDPPEFNLYAQTSFEGSTRIVAKLYFAKSEQVQHHQLMRYDARLYYPGEPPRNRTHTFLGQTFSFKEAFNLLQGRSVHKEFQSPWTGPYSAWVNLNFDQKDADGRYKFREYSQRYGFDLEKVLAKYPLAELDDPTRKAALLASLREGDAAPVTAVKATKTERWAVAACPQFKTILIYTGGKRDRPEGIDSNHEMHG